MHLGSLAFTELGKIVIFLFTLSVLVVLHEYGHFLLARRNGVKVNEFAVGMGPKIFGWTSPRSKTLYSIRALPIGGYCAMEGEDNKSSEAEQQREFRDSATMSVDNFQAKSTWSRLGIVLAGPIANFILCFLILLVGALAFGVASAQKTQPVVGLTLPGWPASVIGLRAGDRFVSIDGTPITSGQQLIDTVHGSLGKKLDIVYVRNDQRVETYATPRACKANAKQGCLGFSPIVAFQRVGIGEAIVASGAGFVNIADQTVGNLVLLATHFSQYAGQIRGPVGMAQAAGTFQDFGWGLYLQFAALISFALGVFNLLPIPALDGGRAAFIIAEMLRGKPVDPEKEAFVHIAGFAALMVLMLVVAFHDVLRIVGGGGVFN